jgi:prolyl oligopeptidase PreP (S9A serine peptidase family)
MGILEDKRGNEGDVLTPQIIMIVLTVLFFMGLIYFANNAASGAEVYEEAYAKQIALFIDKAKPGTKFIFDFKDALSIAEKNKIALENLVRIEDNRVIVRLDSRGGYEMVYFSKLDVDVKENYDEGRVEIYVSDL